MKKLLITGGTGSGKTYVSFNKYAEGRTAYLAPTTLLAWECFAKYGKPDDTLIAGGVKINSKRKENYFGLYAVELNKNFIKDFDTVIIDECHFCFNFPQQEATVKRIIKKFKGNIILVTATIDFTPPVGFTIIEESPKHEFNKIERTYRTVIKRMNKGIKTLVICQRMIDMEMFECKVPHLRISALTRKIDLYNAVDKFESGEITTLIATNVAAQGINLDCENLIIIEFRDFGFGSIQEQKLGRLGRFGLTDKKTQLTYHIDEERYSNDMNNYEIMEYQKDYNDFNSQIPHVNKSDSDYREEPLTSQEITFITEKLLDKQRKNKIALIERL